MTDANLDKLEALAKRVWSAINDRRYPRFSDMESSAEAIDALIASARRDAEEKEWLLASIETAIRALTAIPKPTYVDGNPMYFASDDVPEDIYTALSHLQAARAAHTGEG